MKHSYFFLLLILALVAFGCDDVFEFSPYQANVKQVDKNQTSYNHETLGKSETKNNDTLYIALMADSHYNYYELEKAVNKINTINPDFTVHLGDLSDKGLLKEYEFYSKYVSELKKPVFTCIGNHDYLSSGGKIYKQMFGDYNFSFQHRGFKFIFFDATTLESGKKPDFDWLENEVADSTPKILLSHIPPWDDQYSKTDTEIFKELTANSNIILSIHGHHHNFNFGQELNSELVFLVPGSVDKGNICLLKLYGKNEFSFNLLPI